MHQRLETNEMILLIECSKVTIECSRMKVTKNVFIKEHSAKLRILKHTLLLNYAY